eukprot:gene7422-8242_t
MQNENVEDDYGVDHSSSSFTCVLPWQRGTSHSFEYSNSSSHTSSSQVDEINPGEFVLRALFTEFTVLAERKIERLLKESVSVNLSMCVRNWRKVSAPGRLGNQGKYSPSNVNGPTVGRKQSLSGPNSPNDSHVAGIKPLPTRKVARQLFRDELPHTKTTTKQEREITPGEVAISYLLSDFSFYASRKIERALLTERPLSKSLQRGEDPQFDQLLSSLSSVAEHCLSSLLKTLFQWYDRQTGKDAEELTRSRSPSRAWGGSESPRPISRHGFKDRDALWERRDLAVEFIFCLVLIEVLKQVIGVLALTRFQSVRKKFMQEYKDNTGSPRVLVNIIMGLKFIRIKLFPVEELEESFLFLQECATLFLERNLDKEVKYAFASLFVEILIPVAATAKREYSIPAIKKFVDMLYKDALEMARKARHSSAMYPLVTALLCISQKQFFLSNWNTFLTMCLSHVRSRDTKNQRMAMECLYRLLWVYVIRVKCENHASALTRLRSITETLFPKSSRTVVPRNIPLNIFVKIIQFIAQEKLDFAMQDIIFDLLNVGRSNRQLNPERMNIGLRAFLVIADNLQRKEATPPMPSTIGVLPSGNTLKVKKTFTKLTEQAARSIGVVTYYTSVRRALDLILRTLDVQVGRPMTMNNPQCLNKDAVDMITGERKPKIDLFRTCVAAIPKCVPDGMNKTELVELVSRLTLHLDEELRGLAFTALQSLIMDFPDYREEVVLGYINFTLKEVPDIYPNILESSLRVVLQLIIQWKVAVSLPPHEIKSDNFLEMSMHGGPQPEPSSSAKSATSCPTHVLHSVEGFALVMLCSTKAMHRKLALMVLKEVRSLAKTMHGNNTFDEVFAIDIIEDCAASVIEKALNYVSGSDKTSLGLSPLMDLQLLAEKSALLAERDSTVSGISRDVWAHCFAGFLERIYTHPGHCFCTLQYSWPFVHSRLFSMYQILDPNIDFDSISSRASISVKAPKKPTYMPNIWLWRNYLIFACCTPSKSTFNKNTGLTGTLEMSLSNGSEAAKTDIQVSQEGHNLGDVFRSTVPLIKSESQEIREATVTGLGKTVAAAHAYLLEEMSVLIKVVLDRNAEGVRKKKKRDLLRLQLARVLAANAEQGCFKSSLICNGEPTKYVAIITEYIDGMRVVLEQDNEKDDHTLIQLRLYFSKLIHKMIKSIPSSFQVNLLKNQSRHNLFLLLASWCGHFNISNIGTSMNSVAYSAELEFSALEAMCALVCCGEVFDQNALKVSNGYLYKLLDTMLGSENARVNSLGQETVELLLENNEKIPALLNWVIDRCYTGGKGVSNGCFLAVANVFCKRPYSCRLIPLLCVVLFKTGDGSAEIRERAAQLLHLLDRRFFNYMVPFRAAFAGYSYNQQNFSRELAMTHPELTLPMLAEMTFRFESTSMVGQRCLLNYQVPWLENVELVNTPPPSTIGPIDQLTNKNTDYFESGKILKPLNFESNGWGSVEASQMVLNNLFYITAKFDEYFSKELEAAWAALCGLRETNVQLIIEYLIIMAGLCGSPVLSHAKKVAVYVARANTKKTVDELMDALRLTETVSTQWERIDQPPYYRPVEKLNATTSTALSSESRSDTPVPQTAPVETESEFVTSTKASMLEKQSDEERSGSFGSAKAFAESVLEVAKMNEIAVQSEHKKQESGTTELWPLQWMLMAHTVNPLGVPLPLPDESRYFAPITFLFPMTMPPAHLYRCNFGVMLLTEIVSDRPDVQWIIHLPLMLHVSFLGLDHVKPMVHEHCKRLLINLVVVLVCRGERSSVAKALLDFQSVSNIALHRSISVKGSITAIAEEGVISDTSEPAISEAGSLHRSSPTISQNSERERVASSEENTLSVEEKARELIEFLTKSDCKPLWQFEDITPRNNAIKSADQLEVFLRMVTGIFEEAVPHAHLLERWGYEALHWATSCSSRHYAGRSFQMFRGIHTPLTWTMLSDVLQRLVESVAESSDDMQGYVMEILLTILSAVDGAFSEAPKPYLEDFLLSKMSNQVSMDDLRLHMPHYKLSDSSAMTGHSRSYSTDFDLGYPLRHRSSVDNPNLKTHKRYTSELTLPKIAPHHMANVPSLKELTDFQQLPENPLDMVARLFWVGVSLLESDFEHEFLMAIRLLEKVLDAMDLTKSEGLERVERIARKLNWPGFPGLQSLLLKGLTSSITADSTLHLLANLTTMTSISIIDPSPATGLSLNILALLPMLVTHFDDVDDTSKAVATNIAKACERDKSLANLGKIMLMYRDGEYSKPQQTWIEVVCKCMLDVFPHLSTTMLALLVEILEQGPAHFQQPVLNMICAILKYSDATSPGLKQFHGHLLKVVTAHVKDVNLWKDSLSILKLVVSNSSQIHEADDCVEDNAIRSSDLIQPRASIASFLSLAPKLPWGSSLTLADSSWSVTPQSLRKELPGRTLQFTYDVQATPLIGAKFNHGSKECVFDSKVDESSSSAAPCWRRPYACQKRTRERLVQLLPLCGHKGTLKASLSVIFSSSSDLAVESKQGPSSGEASGDEQVDDKMDETGFSGKQLRNLFTEFDFLDDELDKESEDMSSFGWASTTELRKSESMEHLRNIPSRSESEEDLREMKDEELTDEEDSELASSLPSSVMTSMKEEEAEAVDDDEEESEKEESPSASIFEVRTDTNITEKPEPSPASCYSGSTIDALEHDLNQDVDDKDAAIVNANELKGFFTPTALIATFDEIPCQWSSFLKSFISSPTVLSAAESLPYFPLILKASGYWVKRLTIDCCGKIKPYFEELNEKFSMIIEILESQLQVPHVYLDTEPFQSGDLLARHKCTVLKFDESIKMLQDRREHVLEQLESLQISEEEEGQNSEGNEDGFRFQFFGSGGSDIEELRKMNARLLRRLLELGTCLYRLHVQFIMCMEIYQSYVQKVVKVTQKMEVTDITSEFLQAQERLDDVISSEIEAGSVREATRKVTESSEALKNTRKEHEDAEDVNAERKMTVEIPNEQAESKENGMEILDEKEQNSKENIESALCQELLQEPLDASEEPIRTSSINIQIIDQQEVGIVNGFRESPIDEGTKVDVSQQFSEADEANFEAGQEPVTNDMEVVELNDVLIDNAYEISDTECDKPADIPAAPQDKTIAVEDLICEEIRGDPAMVLEDPFLVADEDRGSTTSTAERLLGSSERQELSDSYTPSLTAEIETVRISTSFNEDQKVLVGKALSVDQKEFVESMEVDCTESGMEKEECGMDSKESGMEIKESGMESKESGMEIKESGMDEKEIGVEKVDEGEKKKGDVENKETTVGINKINVEDKDTVQDSDITCKKNDSQKDKADAAFDNVDQTEAQRTCDDTTPRNPCIVVTTDENNTDRPESNNTDSIIDKITHELSCGHFSEAIDLLRQHRTSSTDDTGASEHVELLKSIDRDTLLTLLARSMVRSRSSVYVLTGSFEKLADICDQLSECMVELFAAICSVDNKKDG